MPFLNRFGVYPEGADASAAAAAAAAAAAFARADAASFSRVGNIPISSNVGMGANVGMGGPAGLAFPNGLNLMDPHVRAAIARVRAMAPNQLAPNQEHLGMPNPWIMQR